MPSYLNSLSSCVGACTAFECLDLQMHCFCMLPESGQSLTFLTTLSTLECFDSSMDVLEVESDWYRLACLVAAESTLVVSSLTVDTLNMSHEVHHFTACKFTQLTKVVPDLFMNCLSVSPKYMFSRSPVLASRAAKPLSPSWTVF